MHIPDGILPLGISAVGYATGGAATWYSLRKITQKKNSQASIPKASLLTAAFFVASWIHIPVPPASVHLVLNGLLGAVLGYYAFPAILIGLFFQDSFYHLLCACSLFLHLVDARGAELTIDHFVITAEERLTVFFTPIPVDEFCLSHVGRSQVFAQLVFARAVVHDDPVTFQGEMVFCCCNG